MRKIKLTQGEYALVDNEDFERVNLYKWHSAKKESGYRYAHRRASKKCPVTSMHRLITDCPKGLVVDHINHNGLDNRRKNLRVCTHSENMRNRVLQKNNKYGLRGITFISKNPNNQWRATIRTGGAWPRHLGCYRTKKEAAEAYRKASIELHGEFSPWSR